MSPPTEIEPTPPAACGQAVRFLLGGSCSDFLVASRAEALQQHLRDERCRADLWWARSGRGCVAAAMVVHNPGRTGLLLHSPAEANGVDRQGLSQVIQAAARQGLQGGLAFVQVMIDDGLEADRAAVEAAGFEMLARLVHMRQSPPRGGAGEGPGLGWRTARQFDSRELAAVIAATYEASLDCPRLSGARAIDDVLASHRTSGIYRPQSWWIVDVEGAAAGCVLMNDCTTMNAAEIVYLGVVPPFRGRGLARAMLRRAADDARARGLESIELAIDERNVFAQRVYESECYRVTRRRWAYVMFGGDCAAH